MQQQVMEELDSRAGLHEPRAATLYSVHPWYDLV